MEHDDGSLELKVRADKIVLALNERSLSYTELARVSGISRHTINMLRSGQRKSLRITTVQALFGALQKMGFINEQ